MTNKYYEYQEFACKRLQKLFSIYALWEFSLFKKQSIKSGKTNKLAPNFRSIFFFRDRHIEKSAIVVYGINKEFNTWPFQRFENSNVYVNYMYEIYICSIEREITMRHNKV